MKKFGFPDSKYIKRREILAVLLRKIDPPSLDILRRGNDGLIISEFNRQTILRMTAFDSMGSEMDESVETDQVKEMVDDIKSYLNRFMADRPEGHIWIVLCCVFLSYIAKEPLHPKEIAGWRFDSDSGSYLCPIHEEGEESICRYCMCMKG